MDGQTTQRDWRFLAAVAAVAVIAAVRVASTHRVFSEVIDEPAHVIAGHEWLHGSYSIDSTHPPLARILIGLPLWNVPRATSTDLVEAGNQILYHGDRYVKTLARARIGNLVLLIAGVFGVALWARRTYSRGVAILAAALFTTIPAILGHAGLATTDLAVAAMLPFALLALDRFLEAPTLRRGAELGVALALGLLSKFSFLVFFPAAAIVLIAVRWPVRIRVRPVLLAIGVAFLVAWAGYRFHFGRPADVYQHAGFFVEHSVSEPLRPFTRWLARTPLPAPEAVTGLAVLKLHDRDGHLSYLLGEARVKGWWYYFPVVFFYKTPIPFLLLMAWGVVSIVRARDRGGLAFVLIALAIMGGAMTSSINIGIRHILPIYAPLAIVAAAGVAAIWNLARDGFSRAALFALLLWLFGGVARAHPDYMPWFNEAAGADPSFIAADSNIDWGQDVLRLARAVQELKIDRLPMRIVNATRYEPLGIPAHDLSRYHRTRGWVAISETQLRWAEATGDYAWLKPYRPVRRIGKSIRLYSIP